MPNNEFDKYRQYLESITPEKELTLDSALSAENIQWCVERLSAGDNWEVLRRKLGLGPAHKDIRWRRLKLELVRGMESAEKDSLLTFLSDQMESHDSISLLESYVDQKLAEGPVGEADEKNWANYLKVKLDIERFKKEMHKDVQDLKLEKEKIIAQGKKLNTGLVIHFHNNIPRPTEREAIIATPSIEVSDGGD